MTEPTMNYDMVIIGAGPAGIFSAYESILLKPNIKIAIIEQGLPLEKRFCPISKGGQKCINCKSCSIMSGFGGAGAFSDGKYNITNNFGGDLYNYIGKAKSIELMEYVDKINLSFGGENTRMYSTEKSDIKKLALQHGLNLLEARVRHLGTDINYIVLSNMYNYLKEHLDFYFSEEVTDISVTKEGFLVTTSNGLSFSSSTAIVAAGRSGSKWISTICNKLNIPTKSNKVDIGVRVELPYEIFEHITNDTHECKLVFKTKQYSDLVRTFCMNPHGIVTAENTHGIVTANGHSYSDPNKYTSNTNFALLVSNQFTEPFEDSNEYGESIAKFSNLLGGGLLVQQFGDLIKGQRSNPKRMQKCFTTPTLTAAAPGDLSLVLPKRHLDNIIETIYALDKIAPGTANDSTLLYGVEVKFYNSEVEVNNNLETPVKNLYVIGDCSGVTHSLSHASASGIHVARHLFG